MTTAATPTRALVAWWSEMGRWVVPASALIGGTMPKGWTIAKVGELVDLVTDRVATGDDAEYKMAGVRLYGKGVFHRETVRGDKLSAKYVVPLKPGALIYNRLFAWKESFAVVPGELADCFVSNEFPQCIADPGKLLPTYLYLWAISEQTIRAVSAASTGSAAVSRNRFREDFFLDFEMPLPPLGVQRAIVSAWGQSQVEVADLRRRIGELEDQIEPDFLAGLGLTKPKRGKRPKVFGVRWKDLQPRWGVEVNQQAAELLDAASGKYPAVQLGDVIADLENGWSPKCHDRPANADEWGVLKMGAVSFGSFDASENKALLPKANPRPALEVKPGDWLISRANVTRLVGACALVRKARPHLMLCDKIFRAVWRDPSPVLPGYLDEIVKVPHLRHQIENNVTGTSATMKNITKPALLGLRLPLPPLGVQSELVSEVSALRRRIADFKAEADVKARLANAEVEAMILGEKLCPG